MRILISPAKKMAFDQDSMPPESTPMFLAETETLLSCLRQKSLPELRKLLSCNDAIAQKSFHQFQSMDLHQGLTPALFAYDGIQYTYMAPRVFTHSALSYVQTHLRILSGFYGCLRPLDGVAPYRLEMCAPLSIGTAKNLYAFWGRGLYDFLSRESPVLLNLASKEYAAAVRPHLEKNTRWIDVTFGQLIQNKVVEKGVYVKMARGAMVRFLAENALSSPEDMRAFDQLGFVFAKERSTANHYVFLSQSLTPQKRKNKTSGS